MKMFAFTPEYAQDCSVQAWLHQSDRIRPAIVICPGGGYEEVSWREADPVAEPYFAAGYQVFILKYSVGADAVNLKPLLQLANTVVQIRANSAAWCVDPGKIAVCGISVAHSGRLLRACGKQH